MQGYCFKAPGPKVAHIELGAGAAGFVDLSALTTDHFADFCTIGSDTAGKIVVVFGPTNAEVTTIPVNAAVSHTLAASPQIGWDRRIAVDSPQPFAWDHAEPFICIRVENASKLEITCGQLDRRV